ncbi:MAG: GntR family transcriptional regulator [Anaerolineales bacterium]
MLNEPAPNHRQLRNVVADRLRAAILEGLYRPGEWLRQEKLAQELGMSQMPVREALKELAAEGLIEHVPYRGVRVIAFSPADIFDLYAHRAFLEGRAAQAAASRISAAELTLLKQLQADMEISLAPENLTLYRERNRRFHQTIFNASGRDYLIRTLTQIWETFPTMLIGNFASTARAPLPERDNPDVREHRAIIAALEGKNGAEACRAMQEHILGAAEQLVHSIGGQI